MPAKALYLKWRPRTFEEVVGQEHITRTLRNAICAGRIRHAYLFSGPRGTGKTTTARLLAKAVNCLNDDPSARPDNTCKFCVAVNEGRFLDLIEIDAASHTGVDDVRDLRDKIAFAPTEGRYKVYIIDEVHRFSGAAFDALLKTLEEPPEHAIFVLATTEIEKVPATIKSRCQRFDFRRIPTARIVERLEEMTRAEGLKVERAALELLARQATGSLRDAISLLDQLVADPDEEITLELAQAMLGTAGGEAVMALADAIVSRDAPKGLEVIADAMDEGIDPHQFARQLIEHLRGVLLVKTGGEGLVDVSDSVLEVMRDQAKVADRADLLAAIRAFNSALQEMRAGWQLQLPLEMALIEIVLGAGRAQPRPEMESETVRGSQIHGAPSRRPVAATKSEPIAKPTAAISTTRTGPVGDRLGLEVVKSVWASVRAAVHEVNIPLAAMLEHCLPYDVDGNVIIISVLISPLMKKLESESYKSLLERVLGDVLGRSIRVRFISGEQNPDMMRAVEQDELLEEAIKLGGRIVKIEEEEET